jgi:hypothetical protein
LGYRYAVFNFQDTPRDLIHHFVLSAKGNAWAAAGMLRILSTMNHTTGGISLLGQQANLTQWINEILVASWGHQVRPCTSVATLLYLRVFRMTMDHFLMTDPTSFSDMSATALLASVTYRMAVFPKNTSLIEPAIRALSIVKEHVDVDGWLQNTTDPITFQTPLPAGQHSPEGQAFVLLLQAAWQAFSQFISKNKS